MEVVLLAGGLGTRLHSVTGDSYPKSLAKVGGYPFLHYIVRYLQSKGCTRFIFALSHHADMIIENVNETFPDLDKEFSIEDTPLGTGGAIKQALSYAKDDDVLVVNSDSFMEFSLEKFVKFYNDKEASLAILCTEVDDVSRFGAADISELDRLIKFFEKGKQGEGFINSGIYLLKKEHKLLHSFTGKFSFEVDVLSNSKAEVYALTTRGLFFDIGTPEDFSGAQALVENHSHLFSVNNK